MLAVVSSEGSKRRREWRNMASKVLFKQSHHTLPWTNKKPMEDAVGASRLNEGKGSSGPEGRETPDDAVSHVTGHDENTRTQA